VIIAELFLIAGYGYSAMQQPNINNRERDAWVSIVVAVVWLFTITQYFRVMSLK